MTVPTPSPGARDEAAVLADRYAVPKRKSKRFWIWLSVALVTAATVVITIMAFTDGSNKLDYRALNMKELSGTEYQVTVQVESPPGSSVRCEVQALALDFSVTGWKYVDFPATDVWTRNETVVLRTQTQGVAGEVSSCWFVEES